MATNNFSVKEISPKLGGERGSQNPNGPTSSHDLVEQMDFLYVEVIKVINNHVVNPITHTCLPIVEITLGNFKSSTKTLPIGPRLDWNQVFAFDKTKGDVLTVTLTLKDDKFNTSTLIGKRNFRLVMDIPSRVPPDSRIAPQWYSMENSETGYHMLLLMSVWFGTQADEVYSQAWFSDASNVNASCVINTRPKLYLAPRLCYIRVTIVSGHDLISNDGKRTPSVYVKATLGQQGLRTEISSGSNPSWNKDLIFIASEPLDDTVYIELIDRVDEQHEESIGKLKKKLSEMTPLKIPGSAPVMFYDIEPPVKVKPVSDLSRFSSKIKMKLATDQAYHVFDECIQYSSDYLAFAKGLWPGVLGKLEIGILGANGLETMKDWGDGRKSTDAYVVAKYGTKWARTRTVVDSFSPKWNEQYSFEVYDKATYITFGIYDNCQIVVSNQTQNKDVPIGKVRVSLNKLEWNRIYKVSIPILNLGKTGLKKLGEIELAIRCVCLAQSYALITSPFRWMLPKAHYKSPLSLEQIEYLRFEAVKVNCLNLAKTEPPLRTEVVMDMLKPKNRNFSMRKSKVNYERLYRIAQKLFTPYAWIDSNVVSKTDLFPKVVTVLVCELFICFPDLIIWLAICWVFPGYFVYQSLYGLIKLMNREYHRIVKGIDFNPPLILLDLKLSKLDSPSYDELAEEFDSFPTSEPDMNVVRMRYDRSRKMSAKVMTLMGDLASQGERVCVLLTFGEDPLASMYFWVFCYVILMVVCYVPFQIWGLGFVVYWVNFPCFRNDLPSGVNNFFRRLPTNEDILF